jgi:hypothetical protein
MTAVAMPPPPLLLIVVMMLLLVLVLVLLLSRVPCSMRVSEPVVMVSVRLKWV